MSKWASFKVVHQRISIHRVQTTGLGSLRRPTAAHSAINAEEIPSRTVLRDFRNDSGRIWWQTRAEQQGGPEARGRPDRDCRSAFMRIPACAHPRSSDGRRHKTPFRRRSGTIRGTTGHDRAQQGTTGHVPARPCLLE
jgi:hypothetical protein